MNSPDYRALFELTDQIAIVTGGGGGLGGEMATETAMTRPYLERAGWREQVLGKIPMGRLGEPRDVVGAAVFLASRASDFVVGQTIYVDGGRTLG